MPERGGLYYPIRLVDQFSTPSRKFRAEMRANRKALQEFRAAGRGRGPGAAAKDLQDTTAAAKELNQEQRKRSRRPLTEDEKAARAAKQRAAELVKLEKEYQRSLAQSEAALRRFNNSQISLARKTAGEVRASRQRALVNFYKDQNDAQKEAKRIGDSKLREEKTQLNGRQRDLTNFYKDQNDKQKEAKKIAESQLKEEDKQLTNRQRALANFYQDQNKQQEQAARLAKEQRRERENRRNGDPQYLAEQSVNRELLRQQRLRKEIVQLRKVGNQQFGAGNLDVGRSLLVRADKLEQSLKRSSRHANSLLFTFRRLVGTLALFTLARKGVQSFEQLISSGVSFNDTIRTSTIGVAGLAATLGDVRDAGGRSVAPVKELALATELARDQVKALRQDSLKTVATFEQLLDTFQVSVGPGLAAGLNLDEVRRVTVGISQAASALGVPQNQLAEEVRSLLSGTIQARTTRIATALQISNADIRRLKETGKLFDFLDAKLKTFELSARQSAQETLSGISTLTKGLLQEVLGNAAQPLYDELVDTLQNLFNEVLSVTDAAGNISPNPQAIEVFKEIFSALEQGVEVLREFGSNVGFQGAQDGAGLLGEALQVVVGSMQAILEVLEVVLDIIGTVRAALNGLNEESQEAPRQFGRWVTFLLLAVGAFKLLNKNAKTLTVRAAYAAAPFLVIGKALEFILESITGVNLSLKSTIELVTLGLFKGINSVVRVVDTLTYALAEGFKSAIDVVATKAVEGFHRARASIFSATGNAGGAERERLNADTEAVNLETRQKARKDAALLELKQIEDDFQARQDGIDKTINDILLKQKGIDPKLLDPFAEFEKGSSAADAFVSTAGDALKRLAQDQLNLEDATRVARLELETMQGALGATGGQSGVLGIFNQEQIANAERLRPLMAALADTERQIAEFRAKGFAEDSGALVSAERDRKQTLEDIAVIDRQSLELALARARVSVAQQLPALVQENAEMRSQAAAAQAVRIARDAGLFASQQAVVEAASELRLAKDTATATEKQANVEINALRQKVQSLGVSQEETRAIRAQIGQLELKRDLQKVLAEQEQAELERALRLAALAESGTVTQGLQQGLFQFAQQFRSTFQAGINIAQQSVQQLSSFISSSLVEAFDPTAGSIEEKFARLMQSIAQLILQELLQVAIAKGLTELGFAQAEATVEQTAAAEASFIRLLGAQLAGEAEIAAATTAAAIRAGTTIASGGVGAHTGGLVVAGYHSGGKVTRTGAAASKAHIGAMGYSGGGRPKGLHPRDRIPAWLEAGEFVVNAKATRAALPMLQALNGGSLPITASASAQSAGSTTGAVTGGLVSDRPAPGSEQRNSGKGGNSTVVVPAVVASESQVDRLNRGGENANLDFLRQHAGTVRSILGLGRR